MKKSLFILLLIGSVHAQVWEYYSSGYNQIYSSAIRDSILVVGQPGGITIININTDSVIEVAQTDYLRYGDCLIPAEHVAIDSSMNVYAIASGIISTGLMKYNALSNSWYQYLPGNSDLPQYDIDELYIGEITDKIWVGHYPPELGHFYNGTYSSIGSYYGESVEDTLGNLWTAHYFELSKYDGIGFTFYDSLVTGINTNTARDVAIDHETNKVWFVSTDFDTASLSYFAMLGSFDGSIWIGYGPSNSNIPLVDPSNLVELAIDTNGHPLMVFNWGIIEFDGINSATVYTNITFGVSQLNITAFEVGNDGSWWIGDNGYGLIKRKNNLNTLIDLTGFVPDITVMDIYADAQGNLYGGAGYASPDHFFQTDQFVWNIYTEGISTGPEPDRNYATIQDQLGNIFVAGKGVKKFDGAIWTDLGGPTFGIMECDIDIDSQGNSWVSNGADGFYKYGGGTIINYPHPLALEIQCVEIDDHDNIWGVTTWGNIVKLDSLGNWTTINDYNYFVSNPFFDIEFDSYGNLWTSIRNLLLKYNGWEWDTIPTPFNDHVCDIEIDGANNIWCGTASSGLAMYNGTWLQYNTSNSNIPTNILREMSLDYVNGKLWIGTHCNGLIALSDPVLFTSVPNELESNNMQLFPNPIEDIVHLKLPDKLNGQDIVVRIYTIAGSEVISLSLPHVLSPLSLPLGDLPNGIYIIAVESEVRCSVSKFIVNR